MPNKNIVYLCTQEIKVVNMVNVIFLYLNFDINNINKSVYEKTEKENNKIS